MKITKKVIARLNPCADRHENYLKFYGDKSLSKAQFMGRKNITQEDKLWVAFRLMSKDQVRLAAADIAESVLHLYESNYPGDLRPRKAIEATRNNTVTPEIREAATSAYYATAAQYATTSAASTHAAATSAYYATHSAASTDYYAYYATTPAASAATSAQYAAQAAQYAAHSATTNEGKKTQEKLMRKIILKHWK